MIFCFQAGQKFPPFDLEDSRKGEIELKEDILRTCCKLVFKHFRAQLPRYLYLGGLGSGGGAEGGEGIGNTLQFSGGYNDDDDGYVDDDKVIMNDNYEKEHRVDKQRRGST